MTQKQFKEALLRGQGRCVKAVREKPERYRKVVLWACSHEVAFDAQCEGSKSWFVYQLILAYPDRTPFVENAIESLDKAKSNYGWKMSYLAELVGLMAEDVGRLYRLRTFYDGYDFDLLYAEKATRKRLRNRMRNSL